MVSRPAAAMDSGMGQAINVGGRSVRGYLHAQRATTDAMTCKHRWPELKVGAAAFSECLPPFAFSLSSSSAWKLG